MTVQEILPKRTPPEMPIQTINYCPTGLWEAVTTINIEETRGYHLLSSAYHPQIRGLKVVGVQCWQPHWCHHCQTGLRAPGEADNVGRLEPTWKLIYPSLKMRMQRMLWPTRVGGGIWWYTIVQDAEIIPSSHTLSCPYKVFLEN